ncbi:MAG: T9SS type A sorting domain-containing protein, partial [Bacteroidetes bacterium]|nr:T9SS type A sorting domain-containing protein [Bacteroidota bacterium]
YPKVKVNPVSQQVVHVWDGDRNSMTANIIFDKGDLPVGISDPTVRERFSFSVSPNPCQLQTNIHFHFDREAVVSASMFDLSGRQVWAMPAQTFANGSHTVILNTSQLEPACYIVQLHTDNAVGFQRIIVTPR